MPTRTCIFLTHLFHTNPYIHHPLTFTHVLLEILREILRVRLAVFYAIFHVHCDGRALGGAESCKKVEHLLVETNSPVVEASWEAELHNAFVRGLETLVAQTLPRCKEVTEDRDLLVYKPTFRFVGRRSKEGRLQCVVDYGS